MPLLSLQCALVDMLQSYPECSNSQQGVSNNNLANTFPWQSLNGQTGKYSVNTQQNLSLSERKWLERIWTSEGLQVTSEIQQWWRKARLSIAAPLTLQALKLFGKQDLVERYIREIPCSTLFFVPEALSFCEFVARQQEDCLPLRAIAEFESAIKATHEYCEPMQKKPCQANLLDRSVRLCRSNLSSVIQFPIAPEHFLSSLLSGANIDAINAGSENGHNLVLVSPEIAQLWRPASQEECELLQRVKPSGAVATELTLASQKVIAGLIDDGVLVVC